MVAESFRFRKVKERIKVLAYTNCMKLKQCQVAEKELKNQMFPADPQRQMPRKPD